MPHPLEIVQEKIVGYDARGKRDHTTRAYIKLDESAEALLGELQGVYLLFFLCISLHEISVCARGAMPYTRADVCRVTCRRDGKANISERAAHYAAKWLAENGFIYECGTRSNGEKMYRPCGTYAWFGDDRDRGAKFAPLPDTSAQNDATGVQPVAPLGCKTAHSGVQPDAPLGGEEGTCTTFDNVPPAPPPERARRKNASPRDDAQVRAILRACGMYGKRADALAARVEVELARRWERWCCYARANLNFASPEGIALYRLEEDPHAEPLNWNDVLEWERDQAAQSGQPPEISEQRSESSDQRSESGGSSLFAEALEGLELTASELWRAALDEVRLQLPKQTFDTWLRPSRALGFDGERLIVKTHSPYAREWIETRLALTIQRTLNGIAGKTLTIRYE